MPSTKEGTILKAAEAAAEFLIKERLCMVVVILECLEDTNSLYQKSILSTQLTRCGVCGFIPFPVKRIEKIEHKLMPAVGQVFSCFGVH